MQVGKQVLDVGPRFQLTGYLYFIPLQQHKQSCARIRPLSPAKAQKGRFLNFSSAAERPRNLQPPPGCRGDFYLSNDTWPARIRRSEPALEAPQQIEYHIARPEGFFGRFSVNSSPAEGPRSPQPRPVCRGEPELSNVISHAGIRCSGPAGEANES